MWESLIEGTRGYLGAALRLYGEGDLAFGPPSLVPVSTIGSPSMCGAGAALDRANAMNDALISRFNQRCDRDARVGSLITTACDSIVCGRKVVNEESALFDSAVGALGPVANSPPGMMALLPLANSVVAAVMGQLTGDSGLMGDVSDQVHGADRESPERDSVFLASSYLGSNPLGAPDPFLQSVAGTPYTMGGFSRSLLDCSGAVAALVNYSLGRDPFESRMSTVNAPQWLAARGARPGYGRPGDLRIGFYERGGGGANGHMAATLSDGTRYESSGGYGLRVGGGAAGADNPMFDQHWYIPRGLLA